MKRYRIAVLGLNHYHVTGWIDSLGALHDRVEIVALYDPDPSRDDRRPPEHVDPSLRQSFPESVSHVPFESNLDRLLNLYRPDVALVTLPNALGPTAIIRMAGAGVHILADKPAARTALEAECAFQAAGSAGVRAAVALTRRYGRGWQEVAAMIAGGRLGRLLNSEAVFITSSVKVRGPSNLIFRRGEMGGGVLHWLGIHDLDALMWLTGEQIVEVQAMCATTGDPSIDVEDVISASIRYQSGAIGTVHLAYALPRIGGEGYIAIRGTDASVKIFPDGSWICTEAGGLLNPVLSSTMRYETEPSTGYGAVGAVIIEDLLRSIEEDRDPIAHASYLIDAMRVVDAMYESIANGKVEPVRCSFMRPM